MSKKKNDSKRRAKVSNRNEKLRRKNGPMALMHGSAIAALDQKMVKIRNSVSEMAALDHTPAQTGALMGFVYQEGHVKDGSQGDLVLDFGSLAGEIHRLYRLIRNLDPKAVVHEQDYDNAEADMKADPDSIERFAKSAYLYSILITNGEDADMSDSDVAALWTQRMADYSADGTALLTLAHMTGALWGEAVRLRHLLDQVEEQRL